MSNQDIDEGATTNLISNTFTRTNYTFAGWATTALGAVVYTDQDSYTMGPSNVTLWAVWEDLAYGLINHWKMNDNAA